MSNIINETDNAVCTKYNRAKFLTKAVASVLAIATAPTLAAESRSKTTGAKGKSDSRIRRWVVVTIGNLSRNRYWGESDAKGVRSVICTCTLIDGADFRLIVDPSLANADEMASELDRRSGLKPADISAVFITHEHGDHFAGISHFDKARWLAGPEVAKILNATRKFPKTIEPVTGKLFDAVDVLPTPGHTIGLNSLRFDCNGHSVAVVGDAVATEDFWRERRAFYNSVDFELSARSMDKIARVADFVIPGHDNYFLTVGRRP
jgi:glyoxylase-like metal-dependent hydrolase (beta-lactamase superfamily II)